MYSYGGRRNTCTKAREISDCVTLKYRYLLQQTCEGGGVLGRGGGQRIMV